MISFSIPLTPPSLNSYVRHTKLGKHYLSPDAIAFKNAVCIFARGRSLEAEAYTVTIIVYMGKGESGDLDNRAKLPIDGLVMAGVIDTDAKVVRLVMEKHRDWESPRTEITVEEYKA